MTEDGWPAEWLRGVLELCVLAELEDGAAHGYAIATRLAEAGLGTVKGGTLYPLLTRLENAGLVTSTWHAGDGGPGRKVFALTGDGRVHLASRVTGWNAFTTTVAGVLETVTDTSRGVGRTTEKAGS